MHFLTIVLGALVLWLFSNVIDLIRNYRTALKCGLPIIISPINPDNMIWMVCNQLLYNIFEKMLPTSLFNNIRPQFYGWELHDRYRQHRRYGKSFVLVSPGEIEVWSADCSVAQVVLARRRDFVPLKIGAKIMSYLGTNILTSDGEFWAKQRRLIAPNLKERISQVVWTESCSQASQMISWALDQPLGEISSTITGLRNIAMNVLGKSGYGQSQKWRPSDDDVESDSKDGDMSFFEAIALSVRYLVPGAVIPTQILRLPFMPVFLQKLGKAVQNFPRYTREVLAKERELAEESAEPRSNFVAMLERLSSNSKEAGSDAKSNGLGNIHHLTDDEIRGNLFVFSAAGFDTSANTMSYAVALLTAFPQWQSWLQEELDEVLADVPAEECGDYPVIFPRMQRCLAIMYETLRLYPAVVHLARSCPNPQTISTSTGNYFIPGNSKMWLNSVAMLSEPDLWGADSLDFRPSRWIPKSEAPPKDAKPGMPQLETPPRGAYLAWSAGPRVCPGQKMSQVEFVGVLSTLFRRARAEPVCRQRESLEKARERLNETVRDSMPRLTLQMNRPQDVKLRWVKR